MKKALLAQQLKLLLLDHLKPGMTPGVIFFFVVVSVAGIEAKKGIYPRPRS